MNEEQALIAALQHGEQSALSTTFELYADKIYRLALRLLNDEQQADGVVQNTFLALIKHIDTFEGRANLATWLYRVAYNDCMMRLRKDKPQTEWYDEGDDDVMPACFVDWENIPELIVTSSEAVTQMEAAVAKLSPRLRAVFLLRDVEELSIRETAASLGISEAAVKVRLHRARLALREQLAHYFEIQVLE